MEVWQILVTGIGAGLIVSELRRRRTQSREGDQSDRGRAPTGSDEKETEVWVELDVEPLFPSSEPVSQEYLLDVTQSVEPDSDRHP